MKLTKSQLKEMIKEELGNLNEAIGRDKPDDLKLFEDYFKQNVSNNFPWINK